MAALTDARNAIWDAVDNWSGLQSGGSSVFKRTYRFDGDDSPEISPHPDQLPALAVEYADSTVFEAKNRTWEYDAGFRFLFWTTSWNLVNCELYELELIKALFQSSANGTAYIVAATGFLPQNRFEIERTRVKISSPKGGQEVKAMETRIKFRLRVRFNALG